jgi:hypothetical protein
MIFIRIERAKKNKKKKLKAIIGNKNKKKKSLSRFCKKNAKKRDKTVMKTSWRHHRRIIGNPKVYICVKAAKFG